MKNILLIALIVLLMSCVQSEKTSPTIEDLEPYFVFAEDSGELVAARDVLLIQVANEPGELARMLEALAQHNLNIEYGYSSGGPGGEKGLVLVPSDVDAAMAVLKAL